MGNLDLYIPERNIIYTNTKWENEENEFVTRNGVNQLASYSIYILNKLLSN